MDWSEGSTVYFSLRLGYGSSSVFTAVVGRDPNPNPFIRKTQHVYIPAQRIAIAVHDVNRIKTDKERWTAREQHHDMPSIVFVDNITAKTINARRHDNDDCRFKGCHDRYHCLWFNPDSEKDERGRKRPYNKIPKSHRVGDEHCPRFFNKADVKFVKRTKPAPPPPPQPKPRPPVILYSIE